MPATSTLMSLPNEVLILIAKYLVEPWNNTDVHTWRDGPKAPTPCTANLCLTSKRLRDISQPLRFSQITVKSNLQMLRLLRSLLRVPSHCQKVQSLRVGYGRFKRFPLRKDYDEVPATFKAGADATSEIPGKISPTLQNVLKRIEAITGFDFVHHSELISDLDEPTFEALQALNYCDGRQTTCLLADDLTSSKFLPELGSLHFQSSAPSTGPQCHAFLPTLARLRSIRHMGAIFARPLSQEASQLTSLDMTTTPTRADALLDVLESCQDLERLSITLESVSFRDESEDEVQAFVDREVDTCLCPKLVSLRVEQKANYTAS
ncbi:uncharacterized protein VDAG_04772 [Verticillium dahliae VdLs.17]|uniref:F-box domain-containing protein n=1 Tax=Verticillium dahliae (strain VdLs.17 / ATCC MYA-4575 / FGSC 10137) TaxID=498257 RepID=G2X435_VERDV|nr:uncharacterized protein VDAG_04772 [Verticillium dahliae VdLs.17]EGY23334.1 hypothetical protein VDAG_04772 [Verticillium dahliae VdLs.17]